MLTRREVAARLGKSVARVRQLEGLTLHPTIDSRGVHWFDVDEVERLAEVGTARLETNAADEASLSRLPRNAWEMRILARAQATEAFQAWVNQRRDQARKVEETRQREQDHDAQRARLHDIESSRRLELARAAAGSLLRTLGDLSEKERQRFLGDETNLALVQEALDLCLS
jgi:hypothetical protein